jgi:hypothetical protein
MTPDTGNPWLTLARQQAVNKAMWVLSEFMPAEVMDDPDTVEAIADALLSYVAAATLPLPDIPD